tara:strand:+ start:3629 stop:4147 length:519 start_codon:yes stop_codon:yes gene_type:complete
MVEKRINNKLREFLQKFKDDIKNHIINKSLCENDEEMKDLLQYIYDYQPLKLTKIDFQKRKRVKNVVPLYNRCCAYRANHEQCTRRKKKSSDFCGTHIKGTPHGVITDIKKATPPLKKSVWIEDIKGIVYYIDEDNNVYDPCDVIENRSNPKIIAKYTCIDGVYDIPSLFKK